MMNKKVSLESGLVTIRGVMAVALFCAGTLSAYLALAGPAPRSAKSEGWRSKVDPSVMAKAAAGDVEFIIYMSQQADLSGAAALATKQAKGAYVYQTLTSVAETSQAPVRLQLTQLGLQYKTFWISNAIWAKGSQAAIQALASLPQVGAIQPVGKGALKLPPQEGRVLAGKLRQPQAIPPMTAAVEPGLAIVNADDVWALGYRGHGVIVAGADTGVRFTHDALKNGYRGWGGSAATSAHDYNWHDAIHIPNWPPEPLNACTPGGPTGAGQPSPLPCDDDELLGGGHGSHTMGTMMGYDGGANQIGMAPGAKWMACRNMSNGVGNVPTYLECMEWLVAPTKVDGTNPDPAKSPDVINNSWGCVEGCPPEPNPLRDTLIASRAAGIFYVVSAGNDGPQCSTIYAPLARYPESFTVGSTTHTTDAASDFSSRGPSAVDPSNPGSPLYRKPNIAAPGSTIRSALRGSDSEYGSLSGTSMAGPHVAGLVALIISANPHLAGNIDRIEDIIEATAVPKTTTDGCGVPPDSTTIVPNNTYGFGRIDALAAVNLALTEATAVPLVSVASRKTHGGLGSFDISVPLSGPGGVECRIGQPITGEHKIVFTFTNPLANVGGVAVTGGTGSVSSGAIGSDPREYIVSLSGVSNAQRVTVKLSGVTDNLGNSSPSISVTMGVLLGDSNGSGLVDSGDLTLVRQQNLQPTSNSPRNVEMDINASGLIDSGDVTLVRQQNLAHLP